MNHNSKQWFFLLGGCTAQSFVLFFAQAPVWAVITFSAGWGVLCGVLFLQGFLSD